MSRERRTGDTPSQPTDEQYVRFLKAEKSFGMSLVVTTQTECATGALADLLGGRPIVMNGLGITSGTILDADKRTAIQELLMRDGSEIMLTAITTRQDDTVERLIRETTCSPTDLAACTKVLDELGKAGVAFMNDIGAPNYGTLSTATDANWAFLSYIPANVFILPDG